MKISAIICEYNPFHNGHKFQINETRKKTGCEAVIAIMSGNYVQRGDAAIFDKFIRARCAVLGGIDLVLELPSAFSMQTAELFAENAVYILNSLNSIDYLVFGAETNDPDKIYQTAALLANETSEFKNSIALNLKNGNTFAKARSEAAEKILGSCAKEILSLPNNILAVEYIKAIIRLNSSMKPISVKRENTFHDSSSVKNCFASAAHIRNMLRCNETEKALEFIPKECHSIIRESAPVFISDFSKTVMYELYKIKTEDLKNIAGVGEGLENRIKHKLETAENLTELISEVKTKRYTESRIRRIMLSAMLGITKETQNEKPLYVRVLDFNDTGRKALNILKKESKLPIFKTTSQIKKISNTDIKRQWFRELMFDKIYSAENNTSQFSGINIRQARK